MLRLRPDICNGYKGKAGIEDLTDDTLYEIFAYLSLREWLLAERVCGRWYKLILAHWRQIKDADLASLMGILGYFGLDALQQSRTVKLDRLEALAYRCGNGLETLKTGYQLRIGSECVEKLAEFFPNLKQIDLSKSLIIPKVAVEAFEMPSLLRVTVLNLDSCFDESALQYYELAEVDRMVYRIIEAMPNVTE